MKVMFRSVPEAEGYNIFAERKGLLTKTVIPIENWKAFSDEAEIAAKHLLELAQEEKAIVTEHSVRLPHAYAAAVPRSIAEILCFPPLCKLSLKLDFAGRVENADSVIRLQWRDETLRAIQPRRLGSVLKWGETSGRLSEALFQLVDAVDDFNSVVGASIDARIEKWAVVQSRLAATTGEPVSADGYLGSLTIYQAGAFALDIRETREGPDFVPVLMARSKISSVEDDAPIDDLGTGADEDSRASADPSDESVDALLTPELHRKLTSEHLVKGGPVRRSYPLDRNVFVILDEALKSALQVVQQKRLASPAERRAFLRNPRAYIVDEDSDTDTIAPSLFIETKQYSERVVGLGIWDPPSLPWLTKRRTQWLPESFEIRVDGKILKIGPGEKEALERSIAAAKTGGSSDITIGGETYPVDSIERELEKLSNEPRGPTDDERPKDESGKDPAHDKQVLIIKTNIDDLEFHLERPRREPMVEYGIPVDSIGSTEPKPHQIVGINWLQKAWAAGWPGVLLADDMGLGKTYQSLVFLAWLKEHLQHRKNARQVGEAGPVLIVAPTALLKNWIAEAERHLVPFALGHRVDAFGSSLQRLKKEKDAGWTPEDALDIEMLRTSDWILTTYETLANYHRSFARVAYSAALFDEIQKIKSPGTINTQAAASINVDFVIGLTGTPIENRIEDLWCIMDRVAPGYLGDLKSFSAKYRDEAEQVLVELKSRLDTPRDSVPQPMLRRMKEAILEGLPTKTVQTYPSNMPAAQAEAYSRVVAQAKTSEKTPGAMLKAIHALRGISLHPEGGEVDIYDRGEIAKWIEGSARTRQVLTILEGIKQQGEKALVFIEDRDVQRVFAVASSKVLGMRTVPQIINGAVAGEGRQRVVDQFQASEAGFNFLILSPKAAGIGLTITAANHVIHLSRWWNPAVEDQCNDRVYRIGQDRPVTIHIPLAIHPTLGENSFDLKLDQLLERKRSLSRSMLLPPVSDGDIEELFGSAVGA